MNPTKIICLAFLLLLQSSLSAQFYAEGGFEMGFLNQKETNRIVSEFNIRENHNIADFKSLSGFRFGFGRYGRFTNMEISFGNIAKKQISKNPNLQCSLHAKATTTQLNTTQHVIDDGG
jgi:hypothetical protein